MARIITVESLKKVYRIPVRNPGLLSAAASIFRPEYNEITAVKGISFSIGQGEIVGFIGPNGAGKTTTLKMLSGLLYPTAGTIVSAGYIPWERKAGYLKKITMLMGNKNQLTWDNTVLDSYTILKEIYNVQSGDFKERLDELADLLEIRGLLKNLARNLSLGERARCEFGAALLHRPEIMFLDEPTLGLDVTMQLKLRNFIREYNKRYGTTIILTSHYMSDIVSLCHRVMLIHEGELLFDGELLRLADKMAPFKLIKVTLDEKSRPFDATFPAACNMEADIIENSERSLTLRVKREAVQSIASFMMEKYILADLVIENPPIEAVIDQVYREGAVI
jgi:ABC-2 type transport system ATP-binding protein